MVMPPHGLTGAPSADEQGTARDRRPSPCSPSSDTPEVDAFAMPPKARTVPMQEYSDQLLAIARKMERERNAAHAKIRDCVTRMDACADGYEDTRKAIADLAAILPENVQSPPTGVKED